jgi:hypothetical protein
MHVAVGFPRALAWGHYLQLSPAIDIELGRSSELGDGRVHVCIRGWLSMRSR